ncbi:dephospho-CoA kinase [Marinomonas piezotolerans]|uniref:Dephospho-CoA kinase n=1 Tax=Marinomonas piezotolerans TaxID=2213058 RepID=A0A370UEE4_9GAMM|nr:dephospho-CoA kinase [Marinomonas piezotolerans]RDL46095.1 dephospho-CoA kinase [Marinomonas piezotolerans]
MSPITIGLTGGIGSGKSTVASLFNRLGIESIDADDVAREVVMPGEQCLIDIENLFGKHILNVDGTLNRAKLREIVFSSSKQLAELEAITHPAIHQKIMEHISLMKGPYCLLVHPLLFEKEKNSLCKFTIAISLPRHQQLERSMGRDNNSAEQINRIMDTQMNDEERSSRADFILKNSGTPDELNVKVIKLHEKILEILDQK